MNTVVVGDYDWTTKAAEIVRAEALHEYSAPDTCIQSSRMGMETLSQFAVKSRPMACAVEIHTRDRWDAFNAGVPPHELPGWGIGIDGRAPDSTAEQRAARLAAQGITDTQRVRGWNGHLVLWVPGPPCSLLVDISADQMHRPERGLSVPGPVVIQLGEEGTRDWLAGRKIVGFGDGIVAIYQHQRTMSRWRESTAWQQPGVSLAAMRCAQKIRDAW